MRRSFDRLAGMVKEEMYREALSGDMYVFVNRRKTMLKVLYWDEDGYAIWQKRLEAGRFERPKGESDELGRSEWQQMLEGLQVKVVRRQRRYRLGEEILK